MTWEDDDNNRQVRFRVDFATGNSDLEIVEIVPTEVTFADSRKIGVHTPGGRRFLFNQIGRSGRFETLKTEIAEQQLTSV
jgi:hypothetical protein